MFQAERHYDLQHALPLWRPTASANIRLSGKWSLFSILPDLLYVSLHRAIKKMNWLRNKRVRAGAEVSLATSATLPNSGTKSVDNSQGSSAAVSELVSGLDFVLDEWDCEGKLIIFLRLSDWYSTVHEC
jgi:hypothetical protein